MRPLLVAALAVALCACSKNPGNTPPISGAQDAGADGGGFDIQTLSSLTSVGVDEDLVAAISADGRIGIAWVSEKNQFDREIYYAEIDTSQNVRSVLVDTVQRPQGLSLAFDPSGKAMVAYLAKDPSDPPDPVPDGGVLWLQHDLGIAHINGFTAQDVLKEYAVHDSNDVLTGNAVADNGFVVGLFPAMTFSDAGLVVAYRDIHDGQFPVQDYGKSDWEAAVYSGGAWQHEMIQMGTDTGADFVRVGAGSLGSIAAGSQGIAVISSGEEDLDAQPENIFYAIRQNGAWTHQKKLFSVGNVGKTGAKLVFDDQEGYAIAWVEMSSPQILYYSSSTDGVNYSNPEQAFGEGSGGWYPSLAFDPNHLAGISYFVCSKRQGQVDPCPASERKLYLAIRRAAHVWDQQVVDPAGGVRPALVFNGGQAVIVYRDYESGALKIARQLAP